MELGAELYAEQARGREAVSVDGVRCPIGEAKLERARLMSLDRVGECWKTETQQGGGKPGTRGSGPAESEREALGLWRGT